MSDNENIRLLKERRSIRRFDSRSIEDDILTQILDATRWCWSAVNRQPWKFLVIRNKELILKVAKECTTGTFASEAPVLIVIVGDIQAQPNWFLQDTCFVSLQLALAAWSFGIGTCFIGNINKGKVMNLLNLTKNDYILTILPLGYPYGEIPEPRPRKSLNEIVQYYD